MNLINQVNKLYYNAMLINKQNIKIRIIHLFYFQLFDVILVHN